MQIIRKNKNSLRTFRGTVPILFNSPFFKLCKQTYSQLHGHCLFFKSVSFNFYITYFLCCFSNFLFFFFFFFLLLLGRFPLSTPRIFYFISQWSCSASAGSLWEMPDTNLGPLPQKSGALPLSHHISIWAIIISNTKNWRNVHNLCNNNLFLILCDILFFNQTTFFGDPNGRSEKSHPEWKSTDSQNLSSL